MTINDYKAGDGIPPHYDTHSPFEEIFVAISLGSQTVMGFKNVDDSNNLVEKHLHVKPRSILIF